MPFDIYSQPGAGPPNTWDVTSTFRTAKQQLIIEERLKQGRLAESSAARDTRDISSFFIRPTNKKSNNNNHIWHSQTSLSQPLPTPAAAPPEYPSASQAAPSITASSTPARQVIVSHIPPYIPPYMPPPPSNPYAGSHPSYSQDPSANGAYAPTVGLQRNGARRLGMNGPFVNPARPSTQPTASAHPSPVSKQLPNNSSGPNAGQAPADKSLCGEGPEFWANERIKCLEKELVEKILNESVERTSSVTWEDIAGLWQVKNELDEIVTLPLLRPDLFVGLLSPCKGVLLFGPPGTGKTLIGKCVACKSNSTFFSISASSLTSKWVGEGEEPPTCFPTNFEIFKLIFCSFFTGEKLVRTLFAIARVKQPAIIFIDEIDSLLTKRSSNEHEASRRLKTEFLLQFDGIGSDKNESLLVIAATNRPQELDDAARRRFTKRLYIPLPNHKARRELISRLMKKHPHQLISLEINRLCQLTKGFSGADVDNLCRDAAKNTIRRIGIQQVIKLKENESLPPILFEDFESALKSRKPSVSPHELGDYVQWNKLFGAIPQMDDDDDEGNGPEEEKEDSGVMDIPVQEMKKQKLSDDVEMQKDALFPTIPVKSEPVEQDDDIQVID